MARPTWPALPSSDVWGALVRDGVYDVSDRTDTNTAAIAAVVTQVADLSGKVAALVLATGGVDLAARLQALESSAADDVNGVGVKTIQPITQADYTALVTKDPYTLYLVKQLDNSVVPQYLGGATNPTPPSGTPSAPGGVVASVTQTTVTIGSLTVPSSTGGSAITGYRFFAYNPAGTSPATFNPEWISATYATLPATFEFTNMVAGTAYQVGVFALNANGEGTRLRVTGTTTAVSPDGGGGVGGGGGLPSKVWALWYNTFQRPRLRELPSDVLVTTNHYILAMAQALPPGGDGDLRFGPSNGESAAQLKEDVLARRAAGSNVMIGMGGSSDGGITITNSTQVTQAFNSIASIVTNYGVNGLDIDLEPSGSSWNQASVVSLVTQLKAAYGSSFIVGVTPGLYSTYTATWMALAAALGSNMDYIAPMLYDFPEARDSRLTAVTIQKCDILAAAGIPQSKWIMGYMLRAASTGDAYNASTPQVILDAYNGAVAKYPSIRGAFLWEQYLDSQNNYGATRLLGKYIRGV